MSYDRIARNEYQRRRAAPRANVVNGNGTLRASDPTDRGVVGVLLLGRVDRRRQLGTNQGPMSPSPQIELRARGST